MVLYVMFNMRFLLLGIALPTTTVALTNAGYDITAAGTYVLSGSTTGKISVDTDGQVRLILNGVTIKSGEEKAIDIDAATNTVIQLADGSENILESSDDAINSVSTLTINGNGSLTITSGDDGINASASDTVNITAQVSSFDFDGNGAINGGTVTVNGQRITEMPAQMMQGGGGQGGGTGGRRNT